MLKSFGVVVLFMLIGLFGCGQQTAPPSAVSRDRSSSGEQASLPDAHAEHSNNRTAPDGAVEFAAHIPKPGIYKAWGQFQRNGTVFTVPYVLKHEVDFPNGESKVETVQ